MLLTLFSDFSCPYSYVTEAAIRSLGMEGLEVVHRAYELYPEPEPVEPFEMPEAERATLERLAEFQGLSLAGAASRPRTRKAHEAALFARERSAEARLREGIFDAYWREGRDIGRIDVLMQLAAEADLDPEELKIALDIDRYEEAVLKDHELARRLRVPGTPTLFIGTGPRARVIAGAHGPAVLRSAIEDALNESTPKTDDV